MAKVRYKIPKKIIQNLLIVLKVGKIVLIVDRDRAPFYKNEKKDLKIEEFLNLKKDVYNYIDEKLAEARNLGILFYDSLSNEQSGRFKETVKKQR